MGATTMIGERVKRIEDPSLLKGEASFVDDIQIPGTLHAAILRSPHANARIRGIDLSAVRAATGVIDAFSLADAWDEPPTSGIGSGALALALPAIPIGARPSPLCRRARRGDRRGEPRAC